MPRPRGLTLATACALLLAASSAAGLQVHQGDLLVTDSANARVLLVDPNTGKVFDFSPRVDSGPSYLFSPAGIAVDPDGSIFVVDSFADHVVQIDPSTGAQSVVHDFSFMGDLGPSDVGTAPTGIDIEETVSGLGRRDLFVASVQGIYQVNRAIDSTFTSLLSGVADLQNGNDVAVEEFQGVPYSLWVVASNVLVEYFFADGSTQILSQTDARNVEGVDFFDNTALFTRTVNCGFVDSLAGLFRYDGPFGGTQVADINLSSCLDRPIAVASPTSVFATFGPDQIVELVPTIGGYQGSVVATLPQGTVAPLAADLAVSPATFPAPEPEPARLALAAIAALFASARRRQLPR